MIKPFMRIENINADFLYKLKKLEEETVNKIVEESDIEDSIKQQVSLLLGARLIERRKGEVSISPDTREVTIKFKYE
jgi:hypothetical protein